jgi:hypothetical protein
LFGAARATIPGAELSFAYRTFDAYIEAEYVIDRQHRDQNYFYSWNEIGWRPAGWARIGLASQRTRVIHNGRDLQRGIFCLLNFSNVTLGLYVSNPRFCQPLCRRLARNRFLDVLASADHDGIHCMR